MNTSSCERILLSAMARADGEVPPVPEQEVREHLAACPSCRGAAREMDALVALLDRQSRRETAADTWPELEPRVRAASTRRQTLRTAAILALGALLIGCRVLELHWGGPTVLFLKLAPLLLATALFGLQLRTNPFRVAIRPEAAHCPT